MIEGFRRMFALLLPGERRAFFILAGMMIVMGLTDAIGVAAILPFLAAVGEGSTGEGHRVLRYVSDLTGIEDRIALLQLLGLFVFVTLMASLAVKTVTIYFMKRFSRMRMLSLSTRLLGKYLGQPYEFFLGRHSAYLGKTILAEVGEVVNSSIASAVRLMANIVIVLFISALLLAIEPVVALFAAGLISACFGITFLVIQTRLQRLGDIQVESKTQRFQLAQEALGGIKDVKVLGLERPYLQRFREPTYRLAKAQTLAQVLAELPRYVMEAAAFGVMILVTVWLLDRRDGDLSAVLPVLGTFAVAGVRLFPTFQEMFRDLTQIRVSRPALDQLYDELNSPTGEPVQKRAPRPLGLTSEIVLDRVGYNYPGTDTPALSDIDLRIPARTTVGFVGRTGAGKTTLLDILLGLMPPSEGALVVDGTPICPDTVRRWQRTIGYVPQSIYLVDDTIGANIALGADGDEPDPEAVQRAARQAALHEFVIGLPDGYETRIGENGIRLSGGQRQRIGIARALYRDPDVLVFDEATSALDNRTEHTVLDAIERLSSAKTILMVAHRLSTVRHCDRILLMDRGRIVGRGTYDELLDHPIFRDMHEVQDA
jgi:ABC-type multidrug transport system fused ATPase/permease subunit